MRNKSDPNIEPLDTPTIVLTKSDAPLVRQPFVCDHSVILEPF